MRAHGMRAQHAPRHDDVIAMTENEDPPKTTREGRIAHLARRIALLVLGFSVLWFAFAAVFGMGQLPSAGHIGAGHAGTTMMAEQMVKWRTIYPSWGWNQPNPPTAMDAYCHHPFGMYWALAPFVALFGHQDFVPPLPAVLMSIASPLLLFGIGRRAWGITAGAAAALSFTVVPIAVGFANFQNLEVMCIFGMLVFFYGAVRLEQTPKPRFTAIAVTGILLTTAGDWVGYLGVGVVLGMYFLCRYAVPQLLPHVLRTDEGNRFWALSTAAAVLSLFFWIALFFRVDKMGDWLGSAGTRSAGGHVPLAAVLKERASWIDFSFTPWVILLGKIFLPITLLRLVIRRRLAETFAPAAFFAAVVQYVAFKQGADVHTFWPHYFAAYFALAMAVAAKTTEETIAFMRTVLWQRIPAVSPVAGALFVGVALPALALPDAMRSLRIWRETGGRYNDHGHFVRDNQDQLHVIKDTMRPLAKQGFTTESHSSSQWGWEQDWALYAPMNRNNAGLPAGDGSKAIWIARASGLTGAEQKQLVAKASVLAFGDVWVVDRRERAPGIVAMNKGERDPNVFESLWYGSYIPVRDHGSYRDDLATWEWRIHLDLAAPAPPNVEGDAPNGDLEGLRIRHNFAQSQTNAARAADLRGRIVASLDKTHAKTLKDGLVFLGTRDNVGAEKRIELWFEVPEGYSKDFETDISAAVVARNPLSFFPPDPTTRWVMARASLPAKLWKPRFIYRWSFPALHRVGKEVYTAIFRTNDGSPVPEPNMVVAELP